MLFAQTMSNTMHLKYPYTTSVYELNLNNEVILNSNFSAYLRNSINVGQLERNDGNSFTLSAETLSWLPNGFEGGLLRIAWD
jgi:hypothetical protein